MVNQKAEAWVKKLDLEPHPEGGYYKETYRSSISSSFDNFDDSRNASTAIYFMLTKGNFSAFHRIRSDEMWHFYDGDPVSIFVIDQQGVLKEIRLGLNIANGESPQALVPAGCWFASTVVAEGDYALVGCTVSPGFDFKDFELANREELISSVPKHSDLILNFTRPIKK
jgi:predicted cupin superfamily sugar epimerase